MLPTNKTQNMTFEEALTAMKEGERVRNGLNQDITYSLQLGKISTEEIDIESGEYTQQDIQLMVDGAIKTFTDLPIEYFKGTPEGDVNLIPEFLCHYSVSNISYHYSFTGFDLLREDWQIVE